MKPPRPIPDAVFTVIDLETTGGVKPENSITEISAMKVSGGRIVDEFTTLTNPRVPISYFISQYTGITNDMVKDAPPVPDVLPQLRAFIGDSVIVAHNAHFDLGFINMELSRSGSTVLENDSLCTVRLARRLVPKHQKKNLGDLAAYFGIEIQNRHRARGDCYATVFVLLELLKLAEQELGSGDLDAVLSLQYKSIRTFKSEPRHIKKIRTDTLQHLPEKSGVYFMKSSKGEVLYIGKSKNLRARVGSYFSGGEGKTDKLLELVASVRRVDYQRTGSELEALLLESKLIKLYRPRYNTLLKRYKSYPFLRLTAGEFPRLEIATEVQADGAEYFGPFSSGETVNDVFDILNRNFKLRECDDDKFSKAQRCIYYDLLRCTAPCAPPDAAPDGSTRPENQTEISAALEMQIQTQHGAAKEKYAAELEHVKAFLSGRDGSLLAFITEKMKKYAAEKKFEDAQELKTKLQSLKRVFYRQASITASVNENNVLILLPSENYSDVCKEFVVFAVRFGRVIEQVKLYADDALDLAAVIERVYFENGSLRRNAETAFGKEEIDEMQILSGWIYHNRASLSCLYVRAEQPPHTAHTVQSLVGEVIDRLFKLSDAPPEEHADAEAV